MMCISGRSISPSEKSSKTIHCDLQTSSPIIAVDTLPCPPKCLVQDAPFLVSTVYENGDCFFHSANLSQVHSKCNIFDLCKNKNQIARSRKEAIEYYQSCDTRTATRGLFEGRQDIVDQLMKSNFAGTSESRPTHVFCVISCTNSGPKAPKRHRYLRVFTANISAFQEVDHREVLQHVISWKLPQPVGIAKALGKSRYQMHVSGGLLRQMINGTILTFDLKGLLPTLQSEMSWPKEKFHDFLSLPHNTIAISSQNTVAFYNDRFQSLLSEIGISSSKVGRALSPQKRSSDSEATINNIHIVEYFATLNAILLLKGTNLFTLSCRKHNVSLLAPQIMSDSLIGSIDRGTSTSSANAGYGKMRFLHRRKVDISRNYPESGWHEVRKRLESLRQEENAEEFEDVFRQYLELYVQPSYRQSIDTDTSQKTTSGSYDDQANLRRYVFSSETKQQIPQEVDNKYTAAAYMEQAPTLHERQIIEDLALQALTFIFELRFAANSTETEADILQATLGICFLPLGVFRWLLREGYITSGHVRRAIQLQFSKELVQESIKDGSITKALCEHDPHLSLLSDYLNSPLTLPIDEILLSIKAIISSLHKDDGLKSMPCLPVENTGIIQNVDSESFRQTKAASLDIKHALSILEDGTSVHGAMLRIVLLRLQSFSTGVLTKSLRLLLSQHEMNFLLQLLRLELLEGGWILSYFGNQAEQSSFENATNEAIQIIMKLMSCIITAMGMLNWLMEHAVQDSKGSEELLLTLQSELSIVLEGVHEATFMMSLLDEFLRYGWRYRKVAPSRHHRNTSWKPPDLAQGTGGIGQNQRRDKRLLPLGLEVNAFSLERKSCLNGKSKKRSRRDIGRELSTKRKKYSRNEIIV